MSHLDIILQADELAIGYGKKSQAATIAKDMSIKLEKGKLTCLLGPNGVGKSTLIKTIMGQIPPMKGKIELNGKTLSEIGPKELSKRIAVVLTDKVRLGNLTVLELVALGRTPHTNWLGNLSEQDHLKIDRAIQLTHISYIQDNVLSELSDGQLQKVMIARALAQDGDLLILDEPTAHLDLINRFEVMQLLRSIAHEEKKSILVVTHDLEIAIDTADEFWLMQCGLPLVKGTPEDLIINGQINLLLPSEQLSFDKITGKVLILNDVSYPILEGDSYLIFWMKLFLRKNHSVKVNEISKISIKESPFSIKIETQQNQFRFETFNDFKSYLEG
ncbi:iron complex transport system ATP-binding protein [Belliella buryatensis]|uniref:Iron complex transport system ATP-binding protein n=1 Tax=Belliella buryatensis TaxID=1500549 RepID=A0A239GRU8_9BACT|nr:ABC transporter ATP-binding protein [Belliella buryatensis]SNS71508.1 iron complex transport system ATP-binding protein [Belliella buryatensis]